MTEQEKRDWLLKATHEDIITQLRFAVIAIYSASDEIRAQGERDYNLITEEILKRMKGERA